MTELPLTIFCSLCSGKARCYRWRFSTAWRRPRPRRRSPRTTCVRRPPPSSRCVNPKPKRRILAVSSDQRGMNATEAAGVAGQGGVRAAAKVHRRQPPASRRGTLPPLATALSGRSTVCLLASWGAGVCWGARGDSGPRGPEQCAPSEGGAGAGFVDCCLRAAVAVECAEGQAGARGMGS